MSVSLEPPIAFWQCRYVNVDAVGPVIMITFLLANTGLNILELIIPNFLVELQSEPEAAEPVPVPVPEVAKTEEVGLGKKIFDGYVKAADVATTLFPLWTVICSGIALKSPSSFAWFTTEYFTAGLAALMLSMGITLTPQDFIDVAKQPGAVGMQFSLCYAVMPLLAFGLAKVFNLSPALLAGMVLVGSINGGQASNLCTYIAKGNVALSVLMTTATTIGAIFMTPVICKALLGAVVPVDAAGIAVSTIQVRSSFALALLYVEEKMNNVSRLDFFSLS
jgi:Sodium Bile acid symporter family